jgi:hypothetical protein
VAVEPEMCNGKSFWRFSIQQIGDVLMRAKNAGLLLVVPLLVLTACGLPSPVQSGSAGNGAIAISGSPAGVVEWNGIFSCTAHIEGKLPTLTLKRIPFRQERNRVTGLSRFTDNFKQDNSVMFSGTLNGESARVAVTALRANGATNFTADMTGSPASMTGQMMSGASQRPVRLCTLALTPL